MEHIITVIVSEVTDNHGRYLGLEFDMDGHLYFYASNQWYWPGICTGPFPCAPNGSTFARHILYTVTRSPAAASSDHAEMYQLA